MKWLWRRLTRFSAWLSQKRNAAKRDREKLERLRLRLNQLRVLCEQSGQGGDGPSAVKRSRRQKHKMSSGHIAQAESIYTELKRLYMGDGLVWWCERLVASHRVFVLERDEEIDARREICALIDGMRAIIDE